MADVNVIRAGKVGQLNGAGLSPMESALSPAAFEKLDAGALAGAIPGWQGVAALPRGTVSIAPGAPGWRDPPTRNPTAHMPLTGRDGIGKGRSCYNDGSASWQEASHRG